MGPDRGYNKKSTKGNRGKDIVKSDIAVVQFRNISTDQVIKNIGGIKTNQ